jgi:hypothetical protein
VKRLAIAAAAAAFLTASTFGAFAAVVTGAITAVHAGTHSVTLDDGHEYTLPAEFDVAVLKAGLRLTFTYEEVDGKRTVSAVSSPG